MLAALDTTSLLLCQLAGEQYAIPMHHMREVLRWRMPTPIPGTPPTILGVIHHRGTVLPIVDVRPLLGLVPAGPSRASRIVSVEHGDVQAGIISDGVSDIVAIDERTIETPSALPSMQAQYLRGIVYHDDRPVALLDLAALFQALTGARHAG